MATSQSLSTSGPPRFLRSIPAHDPNGVLIGLAVFSHMTTESLYFTMGRPFPPSKLPLPMGDMDPILYMVPWANPSPQPKRHLERCSRFVGLTSVTDQQTDRPTDRQTDRQTNRPTDHATRSVTIGRIHVYIVGLMRCGLIITSGQSNLT